MPSGRGIQALSKGVADPVDAQRRAEHDAHDVEAGPVPIDRRAARILAGGVLEAMPLFGVHRAFRLAELDARARLDFDERQSRAMPRDDIDLARAGAGPIVARDDGAAPAAQVAVRVIFTHPAMVVVERAAPEGVGCPVKEADHEALRIAGSCAVRPRRFLISTSGP